jgi:hypothetical protein
MDALLLRHSNSFVRAGSTFFGPGCGAHVGGCGILPVRQEQAKVARREDGCDLGVAILRVIALGLALPGSFVGMGRRISKTGPLTAA